MATDPQIQLTTATMPGTESVPIVAVPPVPKPTGYVVFEEQLEVPLGIASLEDFRKWAVSDDFPERWRIDYLAGSIEVDMSPEDLFFHSKPKTEIAKVLSCRIDSDDRGHILIDRTRISSPTGDVSAEPDIVFISHATIEEGRVRLIPKANGDEDRYIEVEGPPDLVVEIVSDSSITKDTVRLPIAYWAAGVREFWLVDVRGKKETFIIHDRGETAFRPVKVDAEGFQLSTVIGCRYLIERSRSHGFPRFKLTERPVETAK